MKIAVIGVGTAGVTSLCHALRWLTNNTTTVTSIYNPSVKILEIGESMDPGFPTVLFEGAGFTLVEDAAELDATMKLGVSWKGWREKDFTSLMHPPAYAMHFNNGKLKDFCFGRFKKLWGNKFQIIEGSVTDLKNSNNFAEVTVDGVSYEFDFVIDCRGTPKDFTNYNIINDPVNHCLVNIVEEQGTWNTTMHQAHANGWMFGIPLTTRQGWGYLYNDTITSREDAVKDIEKIFNSTNLNLKEFTFKSYYAKEFFDGRIIKNGNSALFFEPLEALSGYFYSTVMRNLVDYINNQCSVDDVNSRLTEAAQDIENFISFAYHGGSTFDSEFWRTTVKLTTKKLKTDARWQNTVAEIKSCLHNGNIIQEKSIARWYIRHWINWDKNLGYNYFSE
jgi:hypothetical protein